jgi:catalase
MVPLVIAPAGGVLAADSGDPVTVQRTFAAARSVEFDAPLLAGAPTPGKDAYGARDAKAGNSTPAGAAIDPRVQLMLREAYRHAKPLGGWADAPEALSSAGIPAEAPGCSSATAVRRYWRRSSNSSGSIASWTASRRSQHDLTRCHLHKT